MEKIKVGEFAKQVKTNMKSDLHAYVKDKVALNEEVWSDPADFSGPE